MTSEPSFSNESENESLDYDIIDYLPRQTKHTKQPKRTSSPPPPEYMEGERSNDYELMDQTAVLDNKKDEPIYIKLRLENLSCWANFMSD